VYQGKKLSYYLKVLFGSMVTPPKTSWQDSQDAARAIRKIGTNALPCLVRWTVTDEAPWEWKAVQVVAKLPQPIQRLFDRTIGGYLRRKAAEPRGRTLAWCGFLALNYYASPAVPELTRILHDAKSDAVQRAACMRALSCVGEAGLRPLMAAVADPEIHRTKLSSLAAVDLNLAMPPEYFICNMLTLGTNAIPAVPLALAWLTNSDQNLAARSAMALGFWRVEAASVVPALANCLRAPDSASRVEVVTALGMYGGLAKAAVPELLEVLTDSDLRLRMQATNVLMKIAPEVLTNGVGK
jgi:hypothetical protein